MKTVTCVQCSKPVDDTDTVELPNGPTCMPCYTWLEQMVEQAAEMDDKIEYDDF